MSNKSMRWVGRILVALALILLIDVIATWQQYKRAVVCVSNTSDSEISNVHLGIKAATNLVLGAVGVKQTRCVEVFPQGEADVSLIFDTPNRKGVTWRGGYIESSGGYEMTITVASADKVSDEALLLRGYVLLPLIRTVRKPTPRL